jgi:hypothetical protein
VLQLRSHGIAGFAFVGHLVLSHEEKIGIAEGSSRSVLDLKLDDPKADVERVLDLNEDDVARQKLCFSYLVQNARGIPYGQNLS